MVRSSGEYIISFDPQRCIQCHGCEVACKAWRDVEIGLHYRRVLNLWRAGFPRNASGSLCLACLHCADPPCAAKCPEGAIFKDALDGRVAVDPGLCTGCRTCREACPYGVPQFGARGIMEKCDLCLTQDAGDIAPPCVDTCPGGALALRRVSSRQKRDHEAQIAGLLALARRPGRGA